MSGRKGSESWKAGEAERDAEGKRLEEALRERDSALRAAERAQAQMERHKSETQGLLRHLEETKEELKEKAQLAESLALSLRSASGAETLGSRALGQLLVEAMRREDEAAQLQATREASARQKEQGELAEARKALEEADEARHDLIDAHKAEAEKKESAMRLRENALRRQFDKAFSAVAAAKRASDAMGPLGGGAEEGGPLGDGAPGPKAARLDDSAPSDGCDDDAGRFADSARTPDDDAPAL